MTIAKPPAEQEDRQWTMPAKNYASTRFSGLDENNTENVKNLMVAWTFETGVKRGQEAAPLVVNNAMYVVTPFPNILHALDLTQPGAPLKWKYEPAPASAAQGVACCDVVNRGAVFSDGKIFYNTLDAYTVAVDAQTGKEVWKTKVGEINQGESITMAPLIVKGKVLVGNSGSEFGVRGWITALDAASGKIAWRAYNTGPDADCLIGPDFKPFYQQDQGKDLGVASWPPDAWKIGGGRCGGGFLTIRSRTSSSTGRETVGRGTQSSGPAIINGRAASSPETLTVRTGAGCTSHSARRADSLTLTRTTGSGRVTWEALG